MTMVHDLDVAIFKIGHISRRDNRPAGAGDGSDLAIELGDRPPGSSGAWRQIVA